MQSRLHIMCYYAIDTDHNIFINLCARWHLLMQSSFYYASVLARIRFAQPSWNYILKCSVALTEVGNTYEMSFWNLYYS